MALKPLFVSFLLESAFKDRFFMVNLFADIAGLELPIWMALGIECFRLLKLMGSEAIIGSRILFCFNFAF